MWVWTVAEQLLNLVQVETIELVEILAEGEDPADEEAEPESYEIVAGLPSGREMLLYYSEDEASARYALEVLASFIATQELADAFKPERAMTLAELVKRVGEKTKN
jgi:hypothetical protein